jgi:hypothetical protein
MSSKRAPLPRQSASGLVDHLLASHGQPRSYQILLWLIVWPKLKAQLRGPLLRSKLPGEAQRS